MGMEEVTHFIPLCPGCSTSGVLRALKNRFDTGKWCLYG